MEKKDLATPKNATIQLLRSLRRPSCSIHGACLCARARAFERPPGLLGASESPFGASRGFLMDLLGPLRVFSKTLKKQCVCPLEASGDHLGRLEAAP
eukprot:1124594-Pyramimonas_sp.AAC.1